MGRPKLPRLAACIICGRSMADPTLDAPSRFGKLTRYHHRCYAKRQQQFYRERARWRRQFHGIEPGYRVRVQDYKHCNGKGGGRTRRRWKTETPNHYRQVCPCGVEYIAGPQSRLCPACQTKRARALKRAWSIRNRDKNRAYMAKWRAAHPGRIKELSRRYLDKTRNDRLADRLHQRKHGT